MSDAPRAVRAHAPAKVNPFLEVLGPRDDGYHELDLCLVALAWGDTLELVPHGAPGARALTLAGPAASDDVPRDGRNLALRALELGTARLRALGHPERTGWRLHLVKEVPSQAGLGAGSSDAAAVLHALEHALGVDLGADWRADALATLGSDCVFFERARTTGAARCTGRGEVVEPLALGPHPWWFWIAVPEVPCPTGAVFGALGSTLRDRDGLATFPPDLLARPAEDARAGLHNTLEAAAFAAVPALGPWRAALADAGVARPLLSGSGSSVFGLCADEGEARDALERLRTAAGARGLALRAARVTRPAGRTTTVEFARP